MTMLRELTDEQTAALLKDRCPDCSGKLRKYERGERHYICDGCNALLVKPKQMTAVD